MEWSSGYNNSCSEYFSTITLLLQEMGTSSAHRAETRIEASGLLEM